MRRSELVCIRPRDHYWNALNIRRKGGEFLSPVQATVDRANQGCCRKVRGLVS